MIQKFPSLLLNKLRLSNPWRYKAPFLISVPYFLILAEGMDVKDAAIGIGASCCTIFGIAGFGYLVNDYTDREEDKQAGKFNVLIGMNPVFILLLLLFFLALAVLPWIFYFPLDEITGSLLIAEFAFFLLYSAPPFRFKERGFLGILMDALYAHANPAVLAAYTFFLLGGEHYARLLPYLVILGTWQGVLGIRNILLHQLSDLEKDLGTGTRTHVAAKGREAVRRSLTTIVVPLELAAFMAFTVLVNQELPFFAPAFLVFMLLTWWKNVRWWKKKIPSSLRQRLYLFLDDFYVQWIPLLVLAGLVLADWRFVFLLAGHLVLFRNAFVTNARESWAQFSHILKR